MGRSALSASPGPSQRRGFNPPLPRWKSTIDPPPRSITKVAVWLSSRTARRPSVTTWAGAMTSAMMNAAKPAVAT